MKGVLFLQAIGDQCTRGLVSIAVATQVLIN